MSNQAVRRVMDDMLGPFRPHFAPEGMVFASKDEDHFFRVCMWATEEELKAYHLITEARAREITDEYKRKYRIGR